MTDLLELPQIELEEPRGDDELNHRTCCDEELALCGLPLPMTDWEDTEESDEDCCEICVNKDRLQQPCGDPCCPLLDEWGKP